MSKFRISRRGFINRSAGAATLGLAACAGGTQTTMPATPGADDALAQARKPVLDTSVKATTPAKPFPDGSISTGARGPGSLPDSSRKPGEATSALPFENVVIVMMENHSFDNYFGMLPKRGQPLADGFTFDSAGNPTNKNPLKGGYQHAFHLKGTCQPNGVTQTWDGTRTQIAAGAMTGFAGTDSEAMGYWDESDIPFYYSLAKTFCVGNRAFCSATAQTYPNRRYLYSGTSDGLIATSAQSFEMAEPKGGTLMDLLTTYGVTWKNYFSDLPALAIVPQNLEKHPTKFTSIAEFYADCAAGRLPQVSFVDPEFGLVDDVGGELFSYLQRVPDLPASISAQLSKLANRINAQGGDEENPQDIAVGEAFVASVVNAVMASPQWPKTLLIWTYDEHGGYYDHVPPMAAVKPDGVPPELSSGDQPGEFNITGIRIPTVVVSPFARPNAVSNVPHDHTAIIATIAAKWNLPALTYRDAQSHTLADYLNLSGPPAFLEPPVLAKPSAATLGLNRCQGAAPAPIITSDAVPSRI